MNLANDEIFISEEGNVKEKVKLNRPFHSRPIQKMRLSIICCTALQYKNVTYDSLETTKNPWFP